MNQANHVSRADFIRGSWRKQQQVIRPPWSLPEDQFVATCSRCGECLQKCPEQIIIKGRGSFPEVDFFLGECTFCHACADACSSQALQYHPDSKSWHYTAVILENCLANQKTICQNCAEQCEVNAITFKPRIGGVAIPSLDANDCTACGACIGSCPVNAMKIIPLEADAYA